MIDNPSAPNWLLDLQGNEYDPLLSQLDEERRRRLAQDQIAQPQPTVAAPQYGPAIPGTPTQTAPAVDPSLELEARNREAEAQMAEAKQADEQAANPITPEATSNQPASYAPQENSAALKAPATTEDRVNQWDPIITAASQQYGVPVNVIKSIMDIESGGRTHDENGNVLRSSAGATSLMQVMQGNFGPDENPDDPQTNIFRGTQMLAERFQRYGTWEQAAASYFGAIDADGNITGASDGNTDGYGYVDAFSAKAKAYADEQQGAAPQYGPSIPGERPLDITNLRPSQLPESNPNLTIDEAYAACGPAAAIVFAAMMGRAPTLEEAVQMGRTIHAWDEGVGMYGPDAEVRLIQALGGAAKLSAGLDPGTIQQEVANGNPVIVDSPGHYGVISGYDPASDRYYFGTSATDLKGGQPWMTLDEYQQLKATGQVRAMLLVDNPLAHGPSSATAHPGPSLPQNFDPSQPSPSRIGENPQLEASRKEMEAAQELAKQVNEQVQKAQEKAKQDQDQAFNQQVHQTNPGEAPASWTTPPINQTNGALDLLRPDQTANQTPGQQPSDQEQSAPKTTEQFVQQVRGIDQQFPVGPDQKYKTPKERDDDPEYQATLTPVVRAWQQRAFESTPAATLQYMGPEAGFYVQGEDGQLRQATNDDIQTSANWHLYDGELAHRAQVTSRQVDARREEPSQGKQIWQMTPDEYVLWRRQNNLPVRSDEYQRHAAAVLDATINNRDIPDDVRAAYGVDQERWQISRRTALSPIMAVANGAPYDGADADTKWHGIMNLGNQVSAIAQDTVDAFSLATLGMLKSGLRAGESIQTLLQRDAGMASPGELSFGSAADRIDRGLEAHPEMQDAVRPNESPGVSFVRSFEPDRFATHAATLGPYLIASSLAGMAAAPVVAAAGLTGTVGALASATLSSLAVTGTTSYGQFYEEATHADPSKGEKKLSPEEAAGWAALHAIGQTAIEVLLQKAIGATVGKAVTAGIERSPVLKKTSELLSRTVVPYMLHEAIGESVLEEAPQQLLENLIAKSSYDPGRDYMDGVMESINGTFGPSAIFGAIGSGHERQVATSRYLTGLDEHALEQMQEQVHDVASAQAFAQQHAAQAEAYGTSVGWDQRQQDLASFRASKDILRYGMAQEVQGRHLTGEQADQDPSLRQAAILYQMAQVGERALADKRGYEAGQRFSQGAANLQDEMLKRGITETVPGAGGSPANGLGGSPENGLPSTPNGLPTPSGDENSGQQKTSSTMTRGSSSLDSGPGFAGESGPVSSGVSGALREWRPENPGEAGIVSEERSNSGPLPYGAFNEGNHTGFGTDHARGFEDQFPTPVAAEPQTEGALALAPSSTASQTVPEQTVRTGQFEAPGREVGGIEGGNDVLKRMENPANVTEVPIVGASGVTAIGQNTTPASLVTRVANHAYVKTFVDAFHRAVFGNPESGAVSARQIVQGIASLRWRSSPEASAPRLEPNVGHIAVGVQGVYGWTDQKTGAMAVNPAEHYHFAVVAVAAEEQANGREYSEEERRERIVQIMAVKATETALHETAHLWNTEGDLAVGEFHGTNFDAVFDPIRKILDLQSKLESMEPSAVDAALQKIESDTRLNPGQGREILDGIQRLIDSTASTFRETFGTVGEQGDQLALLNDDAKEQRLPQSGAENAVTDRDHSPPVNSDVGGRLELPPEAGPGLQPGGPTGANGEGLRSREADASPGTVTEGAHGVQSPEPAPTEPGAESGADAEQRAEPAASPAPVTDPHHSFELARALYRYLSGLQRNNQPVVRGLATAVADRIRNSPQYGQTLDQVDPRLVSSQIGFAPTSTYGKLAQSVLENLFPDTDVSPRQPEARELAFDIAQRISREYDSEAPRLWRPGEIQQAYPSVRGDAALTRNVTGILTQTGYIDRQGREIDPNRRTIRQETTAPAAQPAESPVEAPTAPKPATPVSQTTSPQNLTQGQASTARITAEERGRQTSLDDAITNINDDRFLTEQVRRGGSAKAWGEGLRASMIVDGDPKQTRENRVVILDAIDTRRNDLWEAINAAEANGAQTVADQLRKIRLVLSEVKNGFGHETTGYTFAAPVGAGHGRTIGPVTENISPNEQNVPIQRFRLLDDGTQQVIIRGLGQMAVDDTQAREAKEAWRVVADAVSRVQRSPFVDREGNTIAMTDWVQQAVQIFYGTQTVAPQAYLDDMQQMAQTFLDKHPTIDVELPQLMGLLIQAHQIMAYNATNAVVDAARLDKEAGEKTGLIYGTDGQPIGYGGPRKAEALQAWQNLLATSALMPSIKKLATSAGRTLRMMQFGEERKSARSRMMLLQEQDRTITSMQKALKGLLEQIEKGRPNEVMARFRSIFGEQGGGHGLTPNEQLMRRWVLEQATDGPQAIMQSLSTAYDTMSDLFDGFLKSANEQGFVTSAVFKRAQTLLDQEQAGRIVPAEEIQKIMESVLKTQWNQAARRLRDREINPETGRSYQTETKEKFRERGENYARELLRTRLEDLTDAAQVEALRISLQDGILPDLERVMGQKAPGHAVTRLELHNDVTQKLQEVIDWQRKNDPQTQVYQQAHRNTLAGAVAQNVVPFKLNPQQELGGMYRDEIANDEQLAYLKQWLDQIKNGRSTDPAFAALSQAERESWGDTVQQKLTALEAAQDSLQREIADHQTEMIVDFVNEYNESLDKSERNRISAEQKLEDRDIENLAMSELGLRLETGPRKEALRQALENREIGKVDTMVRALLKEHYHQTYDESEAARYWVSSIAAMEREFGVSTDPQVQARLEENRQRAWDMITQLGLHPEHGEAMAGGLRSELLSAVHGDAGALVRGIQQALTGPGYLVEGQRHPDTGDMAVIGNNETIAALAGDRANPGPLANVLADRFDGKSRVQLESMLTRIEQNAPAGLGTAFKQAVNAAVDVQHRKAAILEMLNVVKDNPQDAMARYLTEIQLQDLRKVLGDHETERWFRQRYGALEIALRRRYDRVVDKGTARVEREAEQKAEAINAYNMLVYSGLEPTVDDARRAVEGKAPKKTASEILIERIEKERAESLRKQIVDVTKKYWTETDAGARQQLDDWQAKLLASLRKVGAYTDAQTGETTGIGIKLAEKLEDQIMKKHFTEEAQQGIRQTRWAIRDEIKEMSRQIRELHRYLQTGHPGDENGDIQRALQLELLNRLHDLAVVGSTEPEDDLKNLGRDAAEKLSKELDIRDARFEEREQTRKGRRAAVEEARELRTQAMALARAVMKDPRDAAVRAMLNGALKDLSDVRYLERQTVTVTDRDPKNGGILGTHEEQADVLVPYGAEQAAKISKMVDVRAGSSIEDLERMAARTDLEREDEQNIIAAVKDRLKILTQAGRSTDDLGRLRTHVTRLMDIFDQLGKAGQQVRTQEQLKLQSTGITRAMGQSSAQTATFFNMIDMTKDANGKLRYDPSSVSRAMRLVATPSWSEYYREIGLISMLSSPTTYGPLGTNMVGNLLNAVLSVPRFVTHVSGDMARAFLTGTDRSVYWSELGAAGRKLADFDLWKQSGKNALQIWWYGRSEEQMREAGETGDLRQMRPEYLVDFTADRGGAWKVVNLLASAAHMGSLRLMKAADEFVGNIAYQTAFEAQLERKRQQLQTIRKEPVSRIDILNNISWLDDVIRQTGHIKENLLFQDRDSFLKRMNAVVHAAGGVNPKDRTILTEALDIVVATYLPFTTVPYNALKQSAELSGLGTLAYGGMAVAAHARGKGNVNKATEDIAQKRGLTLDELKAIDQNNEMGQMRAMLENAQISDYYGKASLGFMVQMAAVLLAMSGGLSGDDPDNPDDRAIDETEKIPPRSIKIGNRWYSYDNTPLAVPFAIAANYFAQKPKIDAQIQANPKQNPIGTQAPDLSAVGQATVSGVKSAIFHNFFLENVIQVLGGLTGQDKTSGDAMYYRLATPWVTRHIPAVLAYYAKQGDTLERDTRGDNYQQRLWNLAESRVPGVRESLPAKLDVLGRPEENKQPTLAGITSYSRSEEARFDPLFRVLQRYGQTNLQAPNTISPANRADAQFDISLPEQQIWQKEFGAHLRTEVQRAYQSSDFNRVENVFPGQSPADALEKHQQQMIAQAVQNARVYGNRAVIQTFGPNDNARNVEMNRRIAAGRKQRATNEYTVAS